MGLSGSDSSGIAFESYPEKGSQEKSTASDLYAEFYFGDCALRYDPYAFITSRPMNRLLGINTNWMTMHLHSVLFILQAESGRQQDGHRSCIRQHYRIQAKI